MGMEKIIGDSVANEDLSKQIKDFEGWAKREMQNKKMDKIFKNIVRYLGIGATLFTGYLTYKSFLDKETSDAIAGLITTTSCLIISFFGYEASKQLYSQYSPRSKKIENYKREKERRVNLN